MLTYQDLLEVPENDAAKMEFVRSVIFQHKDTELYNDAVVAEMYDRKRNKTICDFQRMLITMSGDAVPDAWGADFKVARAFFPYFVVQEVQYLLGNGVTWAGTTVEADESTPGATKSREVVVTGNRTEVVEKWTLTADSGVEKKLGDDFDTRLQDAAHKALVGAVSFGFYNLDHVEVFSVTEFAPLYDEENGHLRAGVRFWQVSPTKPLRATLYEEDGYTDYIWNTRKDGDSAGAVLHPKRAYKQIVKTSEADGMQIVDGENYPGFPIVPMWGNRNHQSELTGLREQIDCYDLIKSGFANNVDDASFVYWAIQNAGGMDDIDLAKFVERMKTVHAAVVEQDGARAEAHSMEAPFQSREALLNRIERDIFKDAMALDVEHIASGATTATQIRAAYEPLNEKTDGLEYCVIEFINGILELAGVDDKPSFTRSTIINLQEEVQSLLMAAQALDPEYVTTKVLTLFGDGDQAEAMLDRIHERELQMGGILPVDGEEGAEATAGSEAEEIVEEAEQVSGKSLNGSQTASLIAVIGKYQAGALSEGQAVKIMSTALGISQEDAEAILKS